MSERGDVKMESLCSHLHEDEEKDLVLLSAHLSMGKKTIVMHHAMVTGISSKWILLNGGLRAHKAVSCLMEPAVGDKVLVSKSSVENDAMPHCFVIAILERSADIPALFTFHGGGVLQGHQGTLTMSAQNMKFRASKYLSLQTPVLKMIALYGDMEFHKIKILAKECKAYICMLSSISHEVSVVADKLWQKLNHSFRRIEQLDETRSGSTRFQVAQRFSIKAKHASVIADGQVKIDGEKVDLG